MKACKSTVDSWVFVSYCVAVKELKLSYHNGYI